MLPTGEGKSIVNFIQLVKSEVTLETSNSDISFDREPHKVCAGQNHSYSYLNFVCIQIKKEELNAPLVMQSSNLEDYPPRFYIFADSALYTNQQNLASSPQLLVKGLSDNCSFKISPYNIVSPRTVSCCLFCQAYIVRSSFLGH